MVKLITFLFNITQVCRCLCDGKTGVSGIKPYPSTYIITIIIAPSPYSPPVLIITTPPPSLPATTYLYCIPCVVFLSTNRFNFRFTSFIICKNTLASSRKLRINLVKSSSVHELSATGNTRESAYVQAKLTFIYKHFFQ